MSDLESFSAFESGNQGSTPESFRLFQERMKVAAAQIKAIKAGEQKQKKKEDELAKILSDFIKTHQNDASLTEFIVHISKLLALNLPAVFILSLIIINFPDLQAQTGLKLISFEEAMSAGAIDAQTIPDLYMADQGLPPAIKIAIDSWVQEISQTAQTGRHKLLQNGLDKEGYFKKEVDLAMSFSLSFYLQKYQLHFNQDFLQTFCRFCLRNIAEQIKKAPLELGDAKTDFI